MNSWAQGEGQPGLGYIFWRKEGDNLEGAGPIAKNIGPERTEAIRLQMGLEDGDACFFAAGDPEKFASFAGDARDAGRRGAEPVDEDRFELAGSSISRSTNGTRTPRRSTSPTTRSPCRRAAWKRLKPGPADHQGLPVRPRLQRLRDRVRLDPEPVARTMVKAFEKAGLSQADVEERFGGLYRAFQYGAPPHGGMAAGVDRMSCSRAAPRTCAKCALFPMNQQAAGPADGRAVAISPVVVASLRAQMRL
jgi:aspartyl-tRNA synthetase